MEVIIKPQDYSASSSAHKNQGSDITCGQEQIRKSYPNRDIYTAMTENMSDIHIPVLNTKVQQTRIAFSETLSSASLINNSTEDSERPSLPLQARGMALSSYGNTLNNFPRTHYTLGNNGLQLSLHCLLQAGLFLFKTSQSSACPLHPLPRSRGTGDGNLIVS